jgi:hypothetical protein
LLLGLASAVIFRSKSLGTHDMFYCLRFETPPTWRARSPYLYPQALGSLFVASYDSQGYGGGILTCLDTWQHSDLFLDSRYIALGRSHRKHFNCTSIVACLFFAAGTCLLRRCLAINVYSDFTIPASGHQVTIWNKAMVAKFKTLFPYLAGETEENLGIGDLWAMI